MERTLGLGLEVLVGTCSSILWESSLTFLEISSLLMIQFHCNVINITM